MNQVTVYLKLLGKHHFWIVCVLIIAVGIWAWYQSVGTLSAEFTNNESAIKNQQSEVRKIVSGGEPHPNDTYDEGMKSLYQKLSGDVRDAWQIKVDQQRDILTWPKGNLPEEFVPKVQSWQTGSRELSSDWRRIYRFQIREELPKLAKIVGAKWTIGSYGGGGDIFGLSNTRAQADNSIVAWSGDNQEQLQKTHFDWTDQPGKLPSTQQIIFAQEDLWVLTALMEIIKATNGEAYAQHNAVIRQIESIKIGKTAAALGKVTGVTKVQAGAPGAGSMGATSPPMASFSGSAAGGDGAVVSDDGRYVDKERKPLPTVQLAAAATSNDAASAYLLVAKRMPVVMNLKMDGRKLTRLLIECGNSELPVEVWRVRFGAISDTAGVVTGPAGLQAATQTTAGPRVQPKQRMRKAGMGDTGRTKKRTTNIGTSADRERSFTGFSSGGALDTPFPYDVPVQVYGIVYLFNTVDKEKLGTGDVSEAARPDGQTSPAEQTPTAEPIPTAEQTPMPDRAAPPPA